MTCSIRHAFHPEYKGGFDVVIGNPPYVLCQPSNTPENILNYYKQFEVASYKIDLFHLFFEQGIKLLKANGKLGYITPNTYLTNKYIKPLRAFILNNTDINYLVQHDETVFVDASVDVATIILSKQKEAENNILLLKSSDNSFIEIGYKNQKDWNKDADCIFNIKSDFNIDTTNCVQLGEICNTYFGIQAFDRKSSISNKKGNDHFLEVIDGGDIYPYSYAIPTKYFNYIDSNIKSGGDWKVYEQERIVIRQIGQIPIVGMSRKDILASNTLYSVYPKTDDYKLQYILCILNSAVIKKYWLSKYSDSKQLFPKIKGYQLRELPIKAIQLSDQQVFISLADQMLSFNFDLQTKRQRFLKRLADNFSEIKITGALEHFDELQFKQFLTELQKQKITLSLKQQDEWEEYFTEYQSECRNFVNQIEATDKEIEGMVYALYGLTEEEVKIIEN
ncbi:MAG: Type IIS restriction enzyme Eco57I [Candidatus Ordinivivax streblomastigis]|uniref:site-specific DNA-methyltransferase (adenine-specific) n=1 Tax=Candidatus Ordinivivax streblomastigis TaxID=2540710 RepID=A0A5M8P2G2_9BACT|nr:MAG: Type IIS restriction enzyme Eco57I [Candidatus Ordinivivax streblomastigis]